MYNSQNKLGFTLIELLAVIVILAIIASIAIPIVLNIISAVRISSQEKSLEMYINAVELSIANNVASGANKATSGKYKIMDNGKKIKNQETNQEIKVEYKGIGLTEGILEIKKGKITKFRGVKINGKYVAKVYDKMEFFDELPESTLDTGRNFNLKIKSLVSESEKKYTDIDNIITSLKFFPYGKLPVGYSKTELLKLKQVDVSKNKDGSILALYDESGNIFIYSDKLIFLNANSAYMFSNFENINTIEFGLTDTSDVVDTSNMFVGCNNLANLNVSNFDTSKVTSMAYMFARCKNLTSLDLNSFDTSSVTSTTGMFSDCSSLTYLNLESFNTISVTNMANMFSGCGKLEEVNLKNFDTTNVTNMSNMFGGCATLNKLDVRSFNTSSVTDMTNMFRNSRKLTIIEVSDKWVIGESTTTTYMFSGCGVSGVTLVE